MREGVPVPGLFGVPERANADRPEIVHHVPASGTGRTSCCNKPVSELPWSDRFATKPDLVTCGKEQQKPPETVNSEEPEPLTVHVKSEGGRLVAIGKIDPRHYITNFGKLMGS